MKSRLQHVHIMFLPFEKDKYKLAKIYKEFFIDTPTSTVSKRDISFVSYPGVITNIDTFTLVNKYVFNVTFFTIQRTILDFLFLDPMNVMLIQISQCFQLASDCS